MEPNYENATGLEELPDRFSHFQRNISADFPLEIRKNAQRSGLKMKCLVCFHHLPYSIQMM